MNEKTPAGRAVLLDPAGYAANAQHAAGADTEAALREWSQKLDRFLEAADRTSLIGRELVEQKALNLDLQRQIHRLEEEVRILRMGTAEGSERTEAGGTTLRETAPVSADAARKRRRRGRSLLQKLFTSLSG